MTETTAKVLNEQRLRTLIDLGAVGARSSEEVCAKTAKTLTHIPADVPFALIYLLDSGTAVLKAAAGVEAGVLQAPRRIDLDAAAAKDSAWPLASVITSTAALGWVLPDGVGDWRIGPWPEPVQNAYLLPLEDANQKQITGGSGGGGQSSPAVRRRVPPLLRAYRAASQQFDLVCTGI